jgi:hypothetical protein
MARMLRVQKQILLLITSFLLSSVYRTVKGVWSVGSTTSSSPNSTRRDYQSLLVCTGRGAVADNRDPSTYALELSSSFPFIHIQSLSFKAVPIALSHTPYLSGMAGLPDLSATQVAQGACASPGTGNANAPSSPNGNVVAPSNPPSTNVTVTQTINPPASPNNPNPNPNPISSPHSNNPNYPCTDSGCGTGTPSPSGEIYF